MAAHDLSMPLASKEKVARTSKMCNANWELILEYLKVFFNWPPMAVVMCVLLVTIFRGAIENLIKRLTEGDILGQKFKAVPPQALDVDLSSGIEQLSEKAVEASSEAVPNQGPAPDELPFELRGDPNAATAIEYVKKNPVQMVVDYKRLTAAYNNERLFGRVFGSQIRLLEHLATYPNGWFTLPQLGFFHAEHQRQVGRTDYQLAPYVDFLLAAGVLEVSGTAGPHHYKITQAGVDFLSYIKANYPREWDKRYY